MSNFDYNAEADRVHQLNRRWWTDLDTGEYPIKRNIGTLCMLIISEFAEALEGARKNKMDDHLPHRKAFDVELADARIRMLDMLGQARVENKVNDSDLDLNELMNEIKSSRRTNFDKSEEVGEDLIILTSYIVDIFEAFRTQNYSRFFLDCGYALDLIEIIAELYDVDLEGAYNEKLEYNRTRKDHTLEARRADGGKKW